MPFWPGTGIPYGISPFAFSAGTAEARITVALGVNFASVTTDAGCSGGVGAAAATFDFRELGRRAPAEVRFVLLSV